MTDSRFSKQDIDNQGADRRFGGFPMVEPVMYDPTSDTLNRMYPSNALNLKPFDYVSMVISPDTTETYTFKSGGSSGTTTNTVVIVYTDNTRADISTVTKT
jgi:hypothetical protein